MKPFARSLPAILLVAAIVPIPLVAQESGDRNTATETRAETEAVRLVHAAEARKPLILEPGEYDWWDVLERVGDQMRRSYVLGDTIGKQPPVPPIVLRFPLRIDEPGFERFAGQILSHASAFSIPLHDDDKSGLWQVLRFGGPRRTEYFERARFMSPEEVIALGDDPRAVITTFDMREVNAYGFANEMRQLAQMNGSQNSLIVISSQQSNMITIMGSASRVAAMLEIARRYEASVTKGLPVGIEARMRQLEAKVEALEARAAPPATEAKRNGG